MRFAEYIENIKSKRIAVIGIGVSNTPLIEKLLENGCNVLACDRSSREKLGETADRLEKMGAELCLCENYLSNLSGGDIIFRTPGMRPDLPELNEARKKGSIITSEMEVFFEVCPCKKIAVTGSDGKTTTTTIISELLKAAGYTVHVGGNIGTPLLCSADEMGKDDIAVLELSSFQLMTMSASPETAVVTNLAPNHLDVHKDMVEYTDAKKNIFIHQKQGDRLILNLDNDVTSSFIPEAKFSLSLFSRKAAVKDGFYCSDGVIYEAFEGNIEKIIDTKDIFLPGVHNIENYMAAFAAVRGLVSHDVMRDVAKTFTGVEHRIEFVRQPNGVKYYNDSIASSPSRTMAGLKSFDQKVILMAGGKDKGVPIDELGIEIMERTKALVLTGFTADKIEQAVLSAPNYYKDFTMVKIDDFRDAVIKTSEIAQSGDIVIMSPACTSFDRFKNFAERGKLFKEIVNSL